MPTLRVWLYVVGVLALVYAVLLVYSVAFEYDPIADPRLNTLAIAGLAATVSILTIILFVRSYLDRKIDELQVWLAIRLDAADGDHGTQTKHLDEITGGLPKIATTEAVRRLIEASDRDRDLQIAGLQSSVDRNRADAEASLQASMKWVLTKLKEIGIQP